MRVARAFLIELAERARNFIYEIPGSAFATVRQRVARQLLELAAASPGTGEPDGELAVQITQQDCRWHGPGGRGTGAASASGERGRAHCALGGRRLGGNRRAEESWQAHHSGMVISGLLRVEMDNGSILEVGPNDVYDVPPAPPGTAGGW